MRRRSVFGLLAAPAFVRAQSSRPQITHGVQSGDPSANSALLWVRGDRPSRMLIEVASDEKFSKVLQTIRGPHLFPEDDFTARHILTALPAGADLHYRVTLEDLREGRSLSEPATGHLRTAPGPGRSVRFLWSGDMVGQGYGINPDLGGIRIFDAMLKRQPDFFLHSGDTIYADGPLPERWETPGGLPWRNIVTEAKSKVAETLADFRGCYQYNLLDENVRRFNSQVAQLWQWDDHEVSNNWSPGKDLTKDKRYTGRDIDLLVSRGAKAFLEYAPIPHNTEETERVYRKVSYGPLVDVFLLDMRSYRAANGPNRESVEGPATVYLGDAQRRWLKREIKASRATWKIIASDMPLGLVVGDGKNAQGQDIYENSANGPGAPLGRELEIADLLRYFKTEKIRNTVWLTADVHYTAAHEYRPERAQFTDFDPFWEFVSGPLNAGAFGPSVLDPTFGIEVKFAKHPDKGMMNSGPAHGMEFFGEVEVDAKTKALTVTLRDLNGAALFTKRLDPQAGSAA